jgi:hypothetical protein
VTISLTPVPTVIGLREDRSQPDDAQSFAVAVGRNVLIYPLAEWADEKL